MRKLSKLGVSAIINIYHLLYEMIDNGIEKKWSSNVDLTKNGLQQVFERLKNDTYNDDFLVKNFVFDFSSLKWEDLLEKEEQTNEL